MEMNPILKKMHIVEITTITKEEFSSIYNAQRRVNEINDREHENVSSQLIPIKKGL